jgi:hypothetical protein
MLRRDREIAIHQERWQRNRLPTRTEARIGVVQIVIGGEPFGELKAVSFQLSAGLDTCIPQLDIREPNRSYPDAPIPKPAHQ